jgi:hypothetical protein
LLTLKAVGARELAGLARSHTLRLDALSLARARRQVIGDAVTIIVLTVADLITGPLEANAQRASVDAHHGAELTGRLIIGRRQNPAWLTKDVWLVGLDVALLVNR